MNSDKNIFREFGNKIQFNSLEDLNKKLASIDYSVKDKTKIEKERYYICNYLYLLANHNFFSYPFEVDYIDTGHGIATPDFYIQGNGWGYYLEVTMSTTTEAIDQIDQLDNDISHEFDIVIDDEKVKVQFLEIDDIEGMKGRPFYGDKPQEFPARIITETIINKTYKLMNYNIDRDKDIELLLYYNFPGISMISWDKVLNYTYHFLQKRNYDTMKKFDRIHILVDRKIIYKILDITGLSLHKN